MLTREELEKRAMAPRPDPYKHPALYQKWIHARSELGLPWRVSDLKGRTKKATA